MNAERLNLILPHEGIVPPTLTNDWKFFDAMITLKIPWFEEMDTRGESLTGEKIKRIKKELTSDFIAVASDLGSFDLAKGHVERLINSLLEKGAQTEKDLLLLGMREFYLVSKKVLGPLWAAYVDKVLSTGEGDEIYLFAARDATPMYMAGQGLLSANPDKYKMSGSKLIHVDWNRWFMGQEDELVGGTKPLGFDDPLLVKFYEQMGFQSGKLIKIIEPGAWGSAANALKTVMPDQPFELWFMFSHMPERIYGFLNDQTVGINPKYMEMINDTAEAMPKAYIRPTELVMTNQGSVMANINEKILTSPFMKWWSWAVNEGAFDAGAAFFDGEPLNVQNQVRMIIALSEFSAIGKWTGVLPRNTLTWSEGESWKSSWKWGKIPPLK